jgi:Kef-type K+ transport system membrane component KefB/voltage-gated potassium channel Kch
MESGTISHYKEFLIILGVSGLVVPLFMRVGINAVLAYLSVGILLSADVLGQIARVFPPLQALELNHQESLAQFGELGVVFLLFLIGLELSFDRLNSMRKLVFGLGGLQVLATLVVVAAILMALGYDSSTALVTGAAMSLSSTAIVVQLLSDAKRLATQTGRTSFAILLFQDLAVIPLLLLVTILGQRTDGSVLFSVFAALAQAAVAIAVIVLVGRYALRPLLRFAAQTHSPDLFMAATLLIAVGAGAGATLAGLSMSLGAFIAGLLLAETEFRRAIEAIIEPFKGLLLGAFFLVVGLSIDLDGLIAHPLRILCAAAILVAIKATIIYGLSRMFRIGTSPAVETALLLGPCGEFAFVLLSGAMAMGILDPTVHADALLIVSLTMLAIPALGKLGAIFDRRQKAKTMADLIAAAEVPESDEPRVILVGFGRVGHLVGSMLEEHKIPYIAVDLDADLVGNERTAGYPVYFGDAANPEFLKRCGIEHATALAVTMDNPDHVDDVSKTAMALRTDLKIVARSRDERHAMRLYGMGVTEAIPETIESSLQLGEALLVESGIPLNQATATVHERRDGFRKLLGRPSRRAQSLAARRRLKHQAHTEG